MLTLAPVSRKFSMSAIDALKLQFPRSGSVQWIGLRPKRDVAMLEVSEALAVAGAGLQGDRYHSMSGKRGITMIQAEHFPVIASLSGHQSIAPAMLRRNLVISDLCLTALIGKRFRIGEVILQGTDHCEPCERMERVLGQGGFNAMNGHGGVCARILQGGKISLGDSLTVLLQQESLF
jgi:MOSC domain-containing protein YiiM